MTFIRRFTIPRLSRYLLALSVILLCSLKMSYAQGSDMASHFKAIPDSFYEGLNFKMSKVEVPDFPDYSVSITDFGAVGDGETLNSDPINKAIKHVSDHGGGTVVVPAGIWLTGPIILQSNVNLYTKKGALVQFSEDKDLYPLVKTIFEGLETWRCMSPIYGKDLENVAITGHGVFDGSGQVWRPVNKSQLTDEQWKQKVASGGVVTKDGKTWYPSRESMKGDPGNFNVPQDRTTKKEFKEVKDFLRPVMVSIRNSKNVLLDGPTFQNSPAWCLHPLMSENVIVRNLTVRNPVYAWNGDGIDLESVKNAVIYNNSFDVGDDAICIKSGKNEEGRKRGVSAQNVIVRDNVVYRAHGGFVVGSEMSGGVRNFKVSDMTFIGTDVGIRFKSTRGRGGTVENIDISNINMIDIVTEPIRFNLYYGGEPPSPNQKTKVVDKKKAKEQIPDVTEATPRFRNISIKNVLCRGAQTAMWIQGLPEMNVKNFKMKNVDITAQKGGMIIDANQVEFSNVNVKVQKGPVLFMQNTHNVRFDSVHLGYMKTGTIGIKVRGPFTENLDLSGVTFKNVGTRLDLGPNVNNSQIQKTATNQ